MLELHLPEKTDTPLKVLCLGAHSDDVEIGCGGTILTLIDRYPNISLHWIVFGTGQTRTAEARASAEAFTAPVREKLIQIHSFRDGFFPYIGGEIKARFEDLKQETAPDLIFTHARGDLHQDHRLISELTWNTFRDHLILEYEIPKYDGDLGTPNVFIHLRETVVRQKIALILKHFASQADKHWFSEDLFLALLRLRGMEARSPEHYAEAFYSRKLVFS